MEGLNAKIGVRIGKLRKKHNMTQEKLAEQMDVSVKHISAVERGLSALSLEKLIQISGILDCSLDYLILGKDSNSLLKYLPVSVLDILQSEDQQEIALLNEYLLMYTKLRAKK